MTFCLNSLWIIVIIYEAIYCKNSTITSSWLLYPASIPSLEVTTIINLMWLLLDIFLSIDICLCLCISRNGFIFFTVNGVALHTFIFITARFNIYFVVWLCWLFVVAPGIFVPGQLPSCGPQAPELTGPLAVFQAWLLCGVWVSFPNESTSLALQGRFLATEPPAKSVYNTFNPVTVISPLWPAYAQVCCCFLAKSCLTLFQPQRLQLARLLLPRSFLYVGFPRQANWVGCHFPLQGVFLTQGSSPSLLLGS